MTKLEHLLFSFYITLLRQRIVDVRTDLGLQNYEEIGKTIDKTYLELCNLEKALEEEGGETD